MNYLPRFVKDLYSARRPLNLQNTRPPAGLRLWILAPHPDDFDAIALTLVFFFQHQAELFLDVASPSSSGVEDGFCRDDRPETKALVREKEQRESGRFFGLNEERISFLHLEEDASGDPMDHPDNEKILTERFQRHQPHLVFMPHGNDPNPGHQRIQEMFRRIVDHSSAGPLPFLNRDPKTRFSRVDAYFPFDRQQADWKKILLRHHRSQQSRNLHQRGVGFDERILQTNLQIAFELGLPEGYAEAFELPSG